MYVCMYVCMYARMHVCVYKSMYVCVYVFMYVCMYEYSYVYVCMCIYTHAQAFAAESDTSEASDKSSPLDLSPLAQIQAQSFC